MKTINGDILRKAIICGTNELDKNKEEINSLNVFPVPDGDTGTNMTMTAHTAAKELVKINLSNIYDIAKVASNGSLRGARGNSGVILSQLFRGFAKGLEGQHKVDTKGLAIAFVKSTEAAYKAVMKPKEGTILTVAKALSDSAQIHSKTQTNIKTMLILMLNDAHKVLLKTEFMLQELKEAKVVDAGGRGLLYILEGALNADYTRSDVSLNNVSTKSTTFQQLNSTPHNVNIKYAYCTEMFIDLSTKKSHKYEDIEKDFITFLDSVGDSVVLVGDEDLVKIHVHTNDPGNVMQYSLRYGELSNIKIENMRLQHKEIVSFAKDIHTKPTFVNEDTRLNNIEEKEIGILAVVSGEGFKQIYKDLFTDYIIEGGQTMNPSTEDFLKAINEINAKNIIIMPNNSNIILAARQAEKMNKTQKNIFILNTKSVPEGISALFNYSSYENIEVNIKNMERAVLNTQTGQITYAVKDSTYKNIEIKTGDILCILDGEIVESKTTTKEAMLVLVDKFIEKDTVEFINIYFGKEGSEAEANEIKNYIEEQHKNIEVGVYEGLQEHYFYLMSAE